MRNTALKAGLPSSTILYHFIIINIIAGLILALEPEAVALYCRLDSRELTFKQGSKYMVVDCGGGTVDIAVHEIDNKGT